MKYEEIAICVIIVRTYSYFEETGRGNSFERFPYLRILSERLTEDTLKEWEQGQSIQAERYWTLLRAIGDGKTVDPVVHTAFDLCLAAMYIPEFSAYLNFYTGNAATIQLAFELEGISCPAYEEMTEKLRCLQKICRIDWNKVPLSLAAMEADNRIFAYLFSEEAGNPEVLQTPVFGEGEWYLCEEPLHPMFIRRKLAEECAAWMQDAAFPTVLQIEGNGGRRFLAKNIAHLLGKNMFMVPIDKCKDFWGEAAGEQKSALLRELFWGGKLFCLYGLRPEIFAEWQITEADFWKNVVLPVLDAGVSVFLCTETRFPVYDGYFPGKRVELKPLSRKERQQVFEGFSSMYRLTVDCPRYSVHYRLSAKEIARALELWKQEGSATEEAFARICSQLLCGGSKKALGEISYPQVRFTDLKVPDKVRETLEQICCSAQENYRIFEEWELGKQYPYGRAVTVMLSGPPGTGKTMTAHAIACELGIPLYQVELSRVMDKYIGETEKHLEEIFTFAEKANVVLFFDEADALFGRRGEVTEGRDRYANMEVSYILQRVEQFDGIVVLSTNFYNNIDKAFLRRMKYVLKYQIPDEALRRSIWESCLPAEHFREPLDMDYLSAQFEFTGGMIKNVVLSACVMAVHVQKRLCMEFLLQAIRTEYEKMEWPVSAGMWGEYGYLVGTVDENRLRR